MQGKLSCSLQLFEKFLAVCNSSKNTGLPQFFFTGFWQLYFKNINFLTKTKRCWPMLTFMNSKLTEMTGKDKQNPIFQKSKSYEISSTDILYIYIYIYIWIYIYICIYKYIWELFLNKLYFGFCQTFEDWIK